MASLGFNAEDFAGDPPFEVWPDCFEAFKLFHRLRTQWRAGGTGGPMGLDYQVAFRLMDQAGLCGQAWDDMLDDLQAAEEGALNAMGDARDDGE